MNVRSLLRSILLLLSILLAAAPALLFSQVPASTPSPSPAGGKKPLVIWPLGDSITQGAGAPGGYRSPLYKLLTDAGYKVSFVGSHSIGATPLLTASGNAAHDGHGSYPSMYLLGNLDTHIPVPHAPDTSCGGFWLTGTATRPAIHPDLILLMAGTNDLGMFGKSPAETLASYDSLLEKLLTLRPNATVICATLAPYNGPAKVNKRDYSRREAKQLEFNAGLPALVAKHKAAGRKIVLCDMRKNFPASEASSKLTADGVHPNQAGYDSIAAGWFEAIRSVFP